MLYSTNLNFTLTMKRVRSPLKLLQVVQQIQNYRGKYSGRSTGIFCLSSVSHMVCIRPTSHSIQLTLNAGLQFLDKTTLGYSSVFGIIPDNHLEGQDYAWASSIFYFGYMLAEYPGVALMQRFPIAKFLGSEFPPPLQTVRANRYSQHHPLGFNPHDHRNMFLLRRSRNSPFHAWYVRSNNFTRLRCYHWNLVDSSRTSVSIGHLGFIFGLLWYHWWTHYLRNRTY